MKKILPPALILLCVFAVSMLEQRYSLLLQESDGLFLLAPDYFRWAFVQSSPVSQIVSDFLVQFYRLSLYAPWTVAGIVCIVFLLAQGILRVTPLRSSLLPAAAAMAVWYFMAVNNSAKPGVAVALCLLPVWLLTLFFRRREGIIPAWADAVASSLLLLVTALLISFNPGVRHAETWAKVKLLAINGRWEEVNKVATPQKAAEDKELTPFALLALDAQHKLGSYMFRYDVAWENDLDMCLESDYPNSLLFKALLYSNLECHNEAVHNYSQLSTSMRHGTSFMVLRKLVSENFLAGNYSLVEKYCSILDRSQTHGRFTSTYRDAMKNGTPHPADSLDFRTSVPVITHSPAYNLKLLLDNGFPPVLILDRLLCTYLLQRDLESFRAALQSYQGPVSELPVHYQEALTPADPPGTPGTYWYYYYSM